MFFLYSWICVSSTVHQHRVSYTNGLARASLLHLLPSFLPSLIYCVCPVNSSQAAPKLQALLGDVPHWMSLALSVADLAAAALHLPPGAKDESDGDDADEGEDDDEGEEVASIRIAALSLAIGLQCEALRPTSVVAAAEDGHGTASGGGGGGDGAVLVGALPPPRRRQRQRQQQPLEIDALLDHMGALEALIDERIGSPEKGAGAE